MRWILVALTLVVCCIMVIIILRAYGPDRLYRVDLALVAALNADGTDSPLFAGAAARVITPRLEGYNAFIDGDGDGLYDPARGDGFVDRNRNGRADFVLLAGFDSNRPATGVGDPLWARAFVLRKDGLTIALVTIDGIGLTHERIIALRHSIDHEAVGLTHLLVASTHTYNAPDTMNLWSNGRLRPLFSSFDERYLAQVLESACEAVLEAIGRLTPAEVRAASTTSPVEGFIRDSRPPFVFDRILAAARFTRAGSDETIATLVSWGNHSEALGSVGTLISSDYPHALRVGVEHGLPEPNGCPGLGGLCLFFVGPIGGLMTPLGVAVPDRDGRTLHSENGVDKAQALGENLALRTVALLTDQALSPARSEPLTIVAQTVFVPVEGVFRIPVLLGLIHPGWYGGWARTEIDALRIGDLEILAVPGELYPEIG